MVHFLIGLCRRLRGSAPSAVSVTPQPTLGCETSERTLRIEPLEARDQPGVIWGT
jgi:hypothetical protein